MPKLFGQANVRLCLDSWEWVVGGGTLAQLEDLDVNQTITELRLADVPADTDLETITKNDRSNLPGEEADAVSFNLTKQLLAAGYEGSISAATSLSSFADGPRDKVVGSISRRLDQFIAGEDPAAIAAAEQAEAMEDGISSQFRRRIVGSCGRHERKLSGDGAQNFHESPLTFG